MEISAGKSVFLSFSVEGTPESDGTCISKKPSETSIALGVENGNTSTACCAWAANDLVFGKIWRAVAPLMHLLLCKVYFRREVYRLENSERRSMIDILGFSSKGTSKNEKRYLPKTSINIATLGFCGSFHTPARSSVSPLVEMHRPLFQKGVNPW